ncbi:replication initiation protein [Campylobacter helveticus]|uniref:replication initiation protein n=2 Tax=Campylobacter helveticus TaxID=28898 RepID=UPI0022EA5974|nr:replication initiation protein [Campylobacter helveticus]
MNEIVKYHNDFNKIKLPNFNELEQNLLCAIFVKIKNKGHEEPVKFPVNDLKKIATSNKYKLNNEEFKEIMVSLFYKFFKADFKILIKDDRNRTGEAIINFFQKVVFWYPHEDKEQKLLDEIELKVNPEFSYIINELEKNFTGFKLEEFIAISGKYTKTLYRILKQFRSTGKAYFSWDEFLRIMDIPENKTNGDIDKFILKPALKELTKERNIFDQIRVPFKNLAYEKEKQKGTRGRGGKVIGITFTFKPENIEMQKLAKESEKIETKEDKYLRIAHNMVKNKARFVYENMLYEANSFDCKELKFMAVRLIRDEFENLIYDIGQTFNAKNKEAFFKMIDTFKNNIV